MGLPSVDSSRRTGLGSSLLLGMTASWVEGGGKEMAIRKINLNYLIFSANRHFFPPLNPFHSVIPSVSEESPCLSRILNPSLSITFKFKKLHIQGKYFNY